MIKYRFGKNKGGKTARVSYLIRGKKSGRLMAKSKKEMAGTTALKKIFFF